MPLLFSPLFLTVVSVAFVGVGGVLIVKRKRLSQTQKGSMILFLVVCAAYYAFLLWLAAGFGSAPPVDPAPVF